jgi:hypothetical protein
VKVINAKSSFLVVQKRLWAGDSTLLAYDTTHSLPLCTCISSTATDVSDASVSRINGSSAEGNTKVTELMMDCLILSKASW